MSLVKIAPSEWACRPSAPFSQALYCPLFPHGLYRATTGKRAEGRQRVLRISLDHEKAAGGEERSCRNFAAREPTSYDGNGAESLDGGSWRWLAFPACPIQRVNAAYNEKDLLKLLELQLEVEQIDQDEINNINNISEDRLRYYNKILTGQSKEIQMEAFANESFFRIRFNINADVSLSPETAIRSLEDDIKSIKEDIDGLRNDLELFQDLKNIKKYLKTYRIAKKIIFGDELFWEMVPF